MSSIKDVKKTIRKASRRAAINIVRRNSWPFHLAYGIYLLVHATELYFSGEFYLKNFFLGAGLVLLFYIAIVYLEYYMLFKHFKKQLYSNISSVEKLLSTSIITKSKEATNDDD